MSNDSKDPFGAASQYYRALLFLNCDLGINAIGMLMKMISVLQNSSLKCLWKSEWPLRITDFGLNLFLRTFVFFVQGIALS